MSASAPVAAQEAAASPRPTASRTIPAQAATVRASTTANTGKMPVSAVRDAWARATKPVAPWARAARASRPRTTSG